MAARATLRELLAAGEPLNPEVIAQVEKAWGLTIRDGYGQTETTLQVGNIAGEPLKPGSMGRPMPGVPVALIDPLTGELADEGEIVLDLSKHPVNLMTGYLGDDERQAEAMAGGYYHTGDVAQRDADGYITYIGRTDDVFKASDYKVSPFELESVLIEHPAVAEAAVVPGARPDPAGRAQGLHRPGAGLGARCGDRQGDPRLRPRATSLPTCGCAGSSSSSCPRRSRGRSGGWSSATASSTPSRAAPRCPRSSATTSSPTSSPEAGARSSPCTSSAPPPHLLRTSRTSASHG